MLISQLEKHIQNIKHVLGETLTEFKTTSSGISNISDALDELNQSFHTIADFAKEVQASSNRLIES